MRSLKNQSESISCKIWFLEHTKIRLNPKDEPSISKIERVMAIFVSQGEAKSQFRQIFKSQNLTQFLRFGPNFLHVSSISIEVQSLNSNMIPKIAPSLISKGGYQIPPPLAWDGINTPLEVRLKFHKIPKNILRSLKVP